MSTPLHIEPLHYHPADKWRYYRANGVVVLCHPVNPPEAGYIGGYVEAYPNAHEAEAVATLIALGVDERKASKWRQYDIPPARWGEFQDMIRSHIEEADQ